MGNKKLKILLGQLNNAGDCLLATTIAYQIKKDYPNSVLTWAVGSCCRHILDNLPHVDNVWEVPLVNTKEESILQAWNLFTKEVEIRKSNNDFDLVFCTQYSHGHFVNYRGITRLSIFAGYPKRIDVPLAPIINLSDREVKKVRSFAETHSLDSYKRVILFECTGYSQQTFITDNFVLDFCNFVANNHPELCIILSTNKQLEASGPNIINANSISFRENAELTKYCDLFIGVSSGITWLCTSTWAKRIPKIILLSKDCPQASVITDHQYFDLDYSDVLELNECSVETLAKLIQNQRRPNSKTDNKHLNQICIHQPVNHHLRKKDFRQVMNMFLTAPKTVYRLEIIKSVCKYFWSSLKQI